MLLMIVQSLKSETPQSKFILVYEKYKNLMFYIARDILKDNHLAEDAVQEAFIIISKNLDKISASDSPATKSFVSIIARNVSLNMAAKRNREILVDDISAEYERLPFHYSSSQDEFLAQYSYELILKAVRKLPSTLKDPLLLYVVQEMSIREIATVLNISIAAAHKRIQRARVKLMEEISKEGEPL